MCSRRVPEAGIRLGALALLLLVAACGGRIPLADLPAEPIAFIRQEPRSGLASLDDFMTSIELNLGGRTSEEEVEAARRRLKTTITLLTPTTGELRPLPDTGLGSFPLDWSQDGLYLLVGRTGGSIGGLQLFSWNRLTGASDRLPVDPTLGGAAFGNGPIRLARVGRVYRVGYPAELGILLAFERESAQPLQGSAGGADPDVAADGRHVVFTRATGRFGDEPIILLGEIGSDEARPIGRGSSPRYSRDGNWITYVSRRRGNADVWLMRADGAAKRAIAESAFDEEFPAVSPDGRFVVYSAARGSQQESQLFLTRVADRTEIQITKNGQNGRPVW